MKLSGTTKKNLKSLGIVTAIFGVLSLYSFNCAPPSFQVADGGSAVLSSTGVLIPDGGGNGQVDPAPVLSQSLLTSEQVYSSLMNITDQYTPVTTQIQNNQLNEFGIREGAFTVAPELTWLNSPMLIALTSFAGSVCEGVVQREQNITDITARKYFVGVNFGGVVTNFTETDYLASVTRMTNNFWGRAPSSEEVTAFTSFRTDFIAAPQTAGLTPADPNRSATQRTRDIAVATCTAILSSYDVFTY